MKLFSHFKNQHYLFKYFIGKIIFVSRYNPRHPEECFSERCSEAQEQAMRYRVCVLPDHPSVQDRTGDANFVEKLTANQDGKLSRFVKDNELEGIISDYLDGGNYTAGKG